MFTSSCMIWSFRQKIPGKWSHKTGRQRVCWIQTCWMQDEHKLTILRKYDRKILKGARIANINLKYWIGWCNLSFLISKIIISESVCIGSGWTNESVEPIKTSGSRPTPRKHLVCEWDHLANHWEIKGNLTMAVNWVLIWQTNKQFSSLTFLL